MTMPVITAPLLEWALWYASQGHPVFPCHTPTTKGCSCGTENCHDIGKHPRIKGWQTHATTDAQFIQSWWKQWPLANIGLATGITLFMMDVDPRNNGDLSFAAFEHDHGVLPETPKSLTGGGGFHLAFALPENISIRNKVDIAPGIDIRGKGGFVIVAPSLHASGKVYAWDVTADLEDIPLAQAPAWLLDLCQTSDYQTPITPEAIIANGQRNNTLSRMAYAMRKAGFNLTEIHEALKIVNDSRCQTPIDQEELLLLVEGKRHLGPDPILLPSQKPSDTPTEWPELLPGTTIINQHYPQPLWLIPGLLVEGLGIIGGLPKVAKSYLAYDIALACAGHGLGLGHFGVNPGKAAYLAIEDDPSDTKQRIAELRHGIQDLQDIFFLHGESVPSISNGLVHYLRHIVTKHHLSLVIIDPLSYIYDPKVGKQTDTFREAKDMLLPLRQLARELHFTLLLVDHRRKQGKDDADVFQTLYGSVAKYAVADTLIMVVRRDDEVMLHCRGRKIKDQVIACEFAFVNGQAYWRVHSANEAFSLDNLKAKIIGAFHDAEHHSKKRALTIMDVLTYAELDNTPQMKETLRVTMFRMCKSGELIKADRNCFLLTGEDDSAGVLV